MSAETSMRPTKHLNILIYLLEKQLITKCIGTILRLVVKNTDSVFCAGTRCNSVLAVFIKIFSLFAVATKATTNPISVIPSGISISSRWSYKTFHNVGSNTDPCGTPLFMDSDLAVFSASNMIYCSDR